MTTINPTSLQSATLLRRPGFTPPTSDHLKALIARRLASQGIDATTLSGLLRNAPGLPSIDDTRQGLSEVSDLLGQLKEKVNGLASGKAASDDAQGVIDALIRSIDDASQRAGLGSMDGDGFRVDDIARQVTNLSVYNVKMAPGQEQKVEVDVRASAQQAALFMDFAGGVLDLGGATSSFTLEVGGRNGTKQLTFSSGTTAQSIAQAFNAFSKETGVEARLSGTGVRLESTATGSAELTTVRVLDDGGASDEAGRIYRMKADDADAADPAGAMTFDSVIAHSGSGIRDKGQDAEVWVNGQKAAVYGSEVLASNDRFSAMFYLDRMEAAADGADAQHLGTFTAFTIRADGQIAPGDPTSPPATIGPDSYSTNDAPVGGGVDPLPPPQADYGTPPVATTGQAVAAGPADPAAAGPKPPKRPGDDGDGDDRGPAIDPSTIRGSIDRLMSRIGARTSALNLIERVGLNVVPASLSGAFGMADAAQIDYPSALGIARTLRESVLGESGSAGELSGGTTSAQVLRLLGVDGNR